MAATLSWTASPCERTRCASTRGTARREHPYQGARQRCRSLRKRGSARAVSAPLFWIRASWRSFRRAAGTVPAKTATKIASIGSAPRRVANSHRSRDNRAGQIRLPLARKVSGSAARVQRIGEMAAERLVAHGGVRVSRRAVSAVRPHPALQLLLVRRLRELAPRAVASGEGMEARRQRTARGAKKSSVRLVFGECKPTADQITETRVGAGVRP